MEMAVILLVSFLALGPEKSIRTARQAGKAMRDIRNALNDVVASIDLSEQKPSSQPRDKKGPSRPNDST